MKVKRILENNLPVYSGEITSWADWGEIKRSGDWDPTRSHYFSCRDNGLTNIEGAPRKVFGTFACSRNKITSLKGGPLEVSEDYFCVMNKLTDLTGVAYYIADSFDCSKNKITSLQNVHKQIKNARGLTFLENPIKSNILGVLLIKGILNVNGDSPAFAILRKHLKTLDVLE